MDNYLEKLIEKNSPHFNSWIDTVNEYLETRYSEKEYNPDQIFEITRRCVNSFSKIAEICFAYGKFKDDWEYDKFYMHLFGPELIIKSLKTKTEYNLGLDNNGIYLSTDLRFNENLRYMDDNFWKLILSLSEYQGFEYDEYEFVSGDIRKKHSELFDTNKGMIFRIFRKYFFDEIASEYHGSVGEFKITWPINSDFEDILKNCCTGFKTMYRLNYDLWKISNLKDKNIKKHQNPGL